MSDLDPGTSAPGANPFEEIGAGESSPQPSAEVNAFDAIGGDVAPGSSATGSFGRAAVRSAVPAAAGLVGASAGAEAGAALGLFGGPLAPFTVPIGGFVGGIAGAIGGSMAASKAQDYALSKAPDTWKEAIGQDDRQQELDQKLHPYASFIGGIAPYALTMRPGGFGGGAKLADNATTWQRLMANPATARAFGGAAMGGMELGNEAVDGQSPDWSKIAISTGFGMVFNKPTRFGEALTGVGARPVHRFVGSVELGPTPLAANDRTEPTMVPTVAQAADAKVMGAGITEDVFQGAHEQHPDAAMAAQDTARTEEALTAPPKPLQRDLHALARQMEPELFGRYDQLAARRDTFRDLVEQHNNPPADATLELEMQHSVLQDHLDTIPTSGAGRNLPAARRVRAQMRDIQSQIDRVQAQRDAFASGQSGDTMEAAIARQHLLDADYAMRDLAPDVSAAYRRAADANFSETHTAPEAPTIADGAVPPFRAMTDMIADAGSEARPQEAAAPRQNQADAVAAPPQDRATPAPAAADAVPVRSLDEQRAFIADDVARRLRAAGRSPEEAEASGQLLAARYLTRAARFGDALGTPEDLYSRTGASIRGPSGKALAPAGAPIDVRQPRQGHAAPRGPQTLKAFARAMGGLKNDGGELSRAHSNLINDRTGVPLDRFREAAAEAGYLGADTTRAMSETTVNDLLDALDKDKVYSVHDQDRVQARQERAAALAEEDRGAPAHEFSQEGGPEPAGYGDFPPDFFAGMPDQDGMLFFQGARGSIRFVDGRRPIISLMKDANASTFIHETGHQWLEEMMADGAHDAAPADVKADAEAIRNWLGVDSADDIKTKHHEKFARGFEQYMREGIAPSPQLAGVFAKFRNWLLSVYQTMKGLGAPINEDIRGVFDRMLSTEPQRTVIAPEQQPGTSVSDLHEADATYIEPHEADAAHDRVVAERDRYLTEQPPEIRLELETASAQILNAESEQQDGSSGGGGSGSSQPAGEVRPSGVGRAALGAGGDDAGSLASGERGGAQSGTLELRSSAAGGQGGNLRGASTGTADNGIAPGPATLFGAGEPAFVDRAGNIRLDTLGTTDDVKAAIREAAQENKDFIGDRRGKVTDGQVSDLAEALGMTGDVLLKRRVGQAFNAEQVVAARQLLIQSATEVSEAMKRAANGTDEDVMAYAEAKGRHQMIQGQVAGLTAEAGRALRAFRTLAGQRQVEDVNQFLAQATGKTLFQLKQEARLGAQIDSPEVVSKYMQDTMKRSFGRGIMEYVVNNLISGVATHTTYTVGNMALLLNKLTLESATAATIGEARAAAGFEGERRYYGEIGAGFRGIAQGFAPALRAVGDALKTGVTADLPGMTGDQIPFQFGSDRASHASVEMSTKLSDLVPLAYGSLRGMRDGLKANAGILAAGGIEHAPTLGLNYSPLGVIPNIAYKGVSVLPVGDIARSPGRMVAAIHSLFRVLNYSVDINQQAWRAASRENLEGNAFYSRVAELRQSPTEDMMQDARDQANNLTLMGESGDFMKKIAGVFNTEANVPLLGNMQPLKFIDPFVNIAGQVVKQSLIERTPLGPILSSEIRRDMLGHNGSLAQDTATAKLLVGSVLGMTFAGLAAEGLASGAGPQEPHEKAMWTLAGNQAYSLRVGDTWYALHRLGPLGVLVGLAADMHDIAHTAGAGDLNKAGAMFMHAVAQNFLDEGFMRGPADLMKAVEDSSRYGERYLQNFGSMFIPFATGMAQQARAMDPYARETRTFIDAVRSKIPGHLDGMFASPLFPRRDIYGQPIPSFTALGGSGLTAIYTEKVNNDPVSKAMMDMSFFPVPVPRKIRNVELTAQQYDDFARIAGRQFRMRMEAMVQLPQWAQMPNETKHTIVKSQLEATREVARGMVMMKNPSIAAQALSAKVAKLRGTMR